MSEIYLTIDDSFSSRSHDLVDYLAINEIPALLFSRGDRLEQYPDQADYALKRGMVLANHSYEHRPSGELSFGEWKQDFEKTETLINGAYAKAGIRRHGYFFRFPYLDRGDGDRVEQRFPALIRSVKEGRRIDWPTAGKMEKIQAYLAERGFGQPFIDVAHPLYRIPELAEARDCFLTYSSCDWMLRPDHLEKDWPYKTLDGLKGAMDDDPYLFNGPGRQIVLFHDHADIIDVTIKLIDHMKNNGVEFVPIKS